MSLEDDFWQSHDESRSTPRQWSGTDRERVQRAERIMNEKLGGAALHLRRFEEEAKPLFDPRVSQNVASSEFEPRQPALPADLSADALRRAILETGCGFDKKIAEEIFQKLNEVISAGSRSSELSEPQAVARKRLTNTRDLAHKLKESISDDGRLHSPLLPSGLDPLVFNIASNTFLAPGSDRT
jgi:hypothetical protein